MSRRTRWILVSLAMAALVAALLLVGDDALARVGGGQNFSSGSRGGGGGFSGGGGGGGEADILFLLLHLAIRYPAVGVPALLIFVGFLAFRAWQSGRKPRFHSRGSQYRAASSGPAAPPAPPRSPAARGLHALRRVDSGFSMPVLLDFLQLVHRRSTQAAVTGNWEALGPFLAPGARKALTDSHHGVDEVSDLVLGAVEVKAVEVGPRWTRMKVVYRDSRVEQRGGSKSSVYLEELWTFRRASSAVSLAPEDTQRMGCPSCGSAVDTDNMGACRSCETPITKGQLQWQAEEIKVTSPRRAAPPPEVSRTAGGVEPGTRLPTLYAPELNAQLRGLVGRHPDFRPAAFKERVSGVYHAIQVAWSEGRWDKARPFVTDSLFQTLRFTMDGYGREGLRNALDDVKLGKVEVVKVDVDAWYEAITVRLWGSMKDYVVDGDGKVVGGNAKVDRGFSEYWTFLRASGTGGDAKDTVHCPSCGAPLDQVDQAGVCGYCETKITTGRFDWVLSRIDQPEVYRG